MSADEMRKSGYVMDCRLLKYHLPAVAHLLSKRKLSRAVYQRKQMLGTAVSVLWYDLTIKYAEVELCFFYLRNALIKIAGVGSGRLSHLQVVNRSAIQLEDAQR